MKPVTRDDVIRMMTALCDLHEELGSYLNTCGLHPSEGSTAAAEMSAFQDPEQVKAAYAQGSALIEVTADHLMAFTRTLTEPVQTVAPWTCVRATLESGALASWLLDPGIGVRMRVQRSFAFRFEGLSQQVKFGRSSGNDKDTQKVVARISAVERKALALGFHPVQDRRRRRIGIAQQMPSTTQLVAEVLDDEPTYRLLSAIAHAHPWALQQASFRGVGSQGDPILEKNLEPVAVAFLSVKAIEPLCKPIWYKSQLFGWDVARIESLFTSAYNSLGVDPARGRFWERSKAG